MDAYQDFLCTKSVAPGLFGAEPLPLPKVLFPFQRAVVKWAIRRGRAALFLDTGLGKQQPTSEPVLTPQGWRTMGDLAPGDRVVGSDGLPTEVLRVFPQGKKRVWRLEMSDGSFVRAGSEHLWSVRTKTHRLRGQPFGVMTTGQIAESIHRQWQLPMIGPAPRDDDTLSVDPYALGVALGDGSMRGTSVTLCTDDWIGHHLGWKRTSDHATCSYVGNWTAPLEFSRALASLGLRGTVSDGKFIPPQFLFASPRQRLALLSGLMDTDGYAMPDGGAEFSSTSWALMEGVTSLVRSLGGVARGLRVAAGTFLYKGEARHGKPAWRVNVKLPGGVPMFRLPRKSTNYVVPTKYQPCRVIRSVVDEETEEEQVCISVAAKDSLYVTRDYVLTHNTLCQLEWARQSGDRVLILAPLAVAEQTIREAKAKLDLEVRKVADPSGQPGIEITNYEKLHRFVGAPYDAIVCDESSILKSMDGATRTMLMKEFTCIPRRLCCTATPAPNDVTELANHAEFLGAMPRQEMLASFFVHDSGDLKGSGAGWRLKGHAQESFWRWVAKWAMWVRKPSDLGFSDEGFALPPLTIRGEEVEVDFTPDGALFSHSKLGGIVERKEARRKTLQDRATRALAIIRDSREQWLVWCDLNAEGDALESQLTDCVQISGKDGDEAKIQKESRWRAGEVRTLITKPGIFGFGVNWQHCRNMMFLGLGDSWERYYQSIRRCWRYGQTKPVDVVIVTSQAEGDIVKNVQRKERESAELAEGVIAQAKESMRVEIGGTDSAQVEYSTGEASGDGWSLMMGDCVERIREIPSDSVGLSMFSPPFSSLYTYSASDRDMGNTKDDESFFRHFDFLIPELKRITMPGRTVVVHCQDLTCTKSMHGFIGKRDFSGELIRAFQRHGWIFDGRITIDKDPQAAAIRTKSKQLLFVQKERDANWLMSCLPDYLLRFRDPRDGEVPVKGDVTNEEWILWARPIWYGIRESDTLNARVARAEKDEKHICPLQLETIERCVRLWSNKEEVVFSPFAGVGSEGFVSLKQGRKFCGIELKKEYYNQACENLRSAKRQLGLF